MDNQELRLLIKQARLTEIEKAKQEMLRQLQEVSGQLGTVRDKLELRQPESSEPEERTDTENLRGTDKAQAPEEEADLPAQESAAAAVERTAPEREEPDTAPEETGQVPFGRKANKVVLGLAGAQHRIGCTHFGIMLACYLRRSGFEVALLEYGREDALGHVEAKGVDVYTGATAESLLRLLADKFYNFLIVDYGPYENCDKMMFNRSDMRFLLSGAKGWETAHVNRIFECAAPETLRQITFVFNFVAETHQKSVRREMKELGGIYFLPLLADPFAADEENVGTIKGFFEEYLQERRPSSRKKLPGIFGKR